LRIFVDADALPGEIRKILFRAAERVRVPLVMVSNQLLRPPRSEYITSMLVPSGADVADDRIVELVEKGDLVVTADIPLADRVVEKGGFALDPRGRLHTADNIKERLATRNLLDQLRGSGQITGGPASFNKKDTIQFANQLDRFLTKHCKE